jgi:hypothetical protein
VRFDTYGGNLRWFRRIQHHIIDLNGKTVIFVSGSKLAATVKTFVIGVSIENKMSLPIVKDFETIANLHLGHLKDVIFASCPTLIQLNSFMKNIGLNNHRDSKIVILLHESADRPKIPSYSAMMILAKIPALENLHRICLDYMRKKKLGLNSTDYCQENQDVKKAIEGDKDDSVEDVGNALHGIIEDEDNEIPEPSRNGCKLLFKLQFRFDGKM